MSKRKKIILISIFLVLATLSGIGLLVSNTPPDQNTTPTLPNPSTGSKLNVSPTLTGPFPTAIPPTPIVQPNDDYRIDYFPTDNTYMISILNQPINDIRLVAEQDLLAKTRTPKSSACQQLKVRIVIPAFVVGQPHESFDAFSFCSQ